MTEDATAPVISRKAMDELRRLAVPIARRLALSGDMNREVRINSLGVQVFSPDSGCRFTDEEEAQIFQESGADA